MTSAQRLQIRLLNEMMLQTIVIVKLLAHDDRVPVELKTIAASVVKSSSELANEVEASLTRRKKTRRTRIGKL